VEEKEKTGYRTTGDAFHIFGGKFDFIFSFCVQGGGGHGQGRVDVQVTEGRQ
jgi:hypothetical protein